MEERQFYSMEAEHGVIGALLLKPSLCEQVGSVLGPESFYDQNNSVLYSLILAESARGRTPDVITISELRPELPNGDLTMVVAAEIQRAVPGHSNVMAYAKVIRERHQSRKLMLTAQAIMTMAREKGSIAEQVSSAQSMLMELSSEDDRPDVITMADALKPVLERLDEVAALKGDEQPEVVGVQFGIDPLDQIIKSIRPGNLAVIAGRPGTGKTVLGLGLADETAVNRNGAALVFSLEMETPELAVRSMAANTGVMQDVIDGTMRAEDDHWPRLTSGVNKLTHADYRLCDKPSLPWSRIASIARFQHRAKPLDVIVIDYFGLIAAEPGSRLFNRQAELGAASRGAKALAKELKVPVVMLAQLNRGIEARAVKRPQLSDLRDCGDLEQDADIIIFAHRDESTQDGEDGLTDIYVEKNRKGRTGHCRLQFRGEIAKFVPSEKKYNRPRATAPVSAREYLDN